MEYRHYQDRTLQHWIGAPFIYSAIVPLVILDIGIEIYHRACFPLYGIPYVRRGDYIRIDRHRLSYLSGIEKLNCAYCGYANGLLNYASVIAATTESYWCGIKHQASDRFREPVHQKTFLPYGDEKAFQEFVAEEKEEAGVEEAKT